MKKLKEPISWTPPTTQIKQISPGSGVDTNHIDENLKWTPLGKTLRVFPTQRNKFD